MEDDHAHAGDDVTVDPADDGVRHIPVAHVAPPEKDVGIVEDFVGQAAFRVVQGSGADLVARFAQEGRDNLMDAVRVDRLDGRIGFLMREFVPDCDFHVLSPFVQKGGKPRKRLPARCFCPILSQSLCKINKNGEDGRRFFYARRLIERNSMFLGIDPGRGCFGGGISFGLGF